MRGRPWRFCAAQDQPSAKCHTQRGGRAVSTAFMAGTSIFCVGSMAVLGAVEEGTSGDYSIYLVKSFMDMIVALNIASTLGRGVMLAALPVFSLSGRAYFAGHCSCNPGWWAMCLPNLLPWAGC